jgi:translation initiation factor 1A
MGKVGKRHKKITSRTLEQQQAPIVFRDQDQDYGFVQKNLGNCRFAIYCNDGKERLGILRGVMRKRVWVAAGDIVLYSLRGYEDDKVDVLHKYRSDEVHRLTSDLCQAIYAMYHHGSCANGTLANEDYVAFGEEDDEERLDSDGDVDVEAI